MGVFPFGRPASERPPRQAVAGRAELFVLGVYPSALHVRWTRPDGVVRVQALAVDDEPEVFWDGADGGKRVWRWAEQVSWEPSWGRVASPSTNGSSGRGVVDDVLRPLGVAADSTHFTDCVRRFLVKDGRDSQRAAIDAKYAPFAAPRGLPMVDLPSRPTDRVLVRQAVEEDAGRLLAELHASGASAIVTLGQPAADVFAELAGHDRVVLRRDPSYGHEESVHVRGDVVRWLPLKHPGQRRPEWRQRHDEWAARIRLAGRPIGHPLL